MATSTLTEKFVRERGPSLHRKAFHLLRHWHDAEDAVQEAFLKALRASDQFRAEHDDAFFHWVLRIVINKALDEIAKKKRESEKRIYIDLDEYLPKIEVAADKEKLQAAIQRLPSDRKIALLDRWNEIDYCCTCLP